MLLLPGLRFPRTSASALLARSSASSSFFSNLGGKEALGAWERGWRRQAEGVFVGW